MTPETLHHHLQQVARRAELALELDVYHPQVIDTVLEALSRYLTREEPRPASRWLPWRRIEQEPQRVSPLLLAGPAGTGKTTLMMLLDRAIPQASVAPLFEQEIAAHPSSANGSGPTIIEIHPLALMGRTQNVTTGVVRLSELQTFYRRFTYDQQRARTDPEAAERFAQLFEKRVLYVDEFVPDTVSSFPMQVINHLADHGVQVLLSSNRRETPFVAGVEVIPVTGPDLRHGDLAAIACPPGPDPRFDRFDAVEPQRIGVGNRALPVREQEVEGERWLYLTFPDLAHSSADWRTFYRLVQQADRLLLDAVPVFDAAKEVGPDVARRFVYLVDALYDTRVPVLLRLTNRTPLPNDFDIDELATRYLPETRLDLDRALSRLRQLETLV